MANVQLAPALAQAEVGGGIRQKVGRGAGQKDGEIDIELYKRVI